MERTYLAPEVEIIDLDVTDCILKNSVGFGFGLQDLSDDDEGDF